jgi:hypothetical protein
MAMLSKPAFGPRTAIIYITVGALIDVWTAVWYFAFARPDQGAMTSNTQFWLWGFFLTGLTLVLVGLFLGHIGRSARRAELPPPETTPAEAQIQTTAAAHPNPVVAGTVSGQSTPVIAAPAVGMMPPMTDRPGPSAAATPAVPGLTRR